MIFTEKAADRVQELIVEQKKQMILHLECL